MHAVLVCFVAGIDIIITYYTPRILEWLAEWCIIQQSSHQNSFYHNSIKYWPIFSSFFVTDSAVNFLSSDYYRLQLTSNLSLHYCVKYSSHLLNTKISPLL